MTNTDRQIAILLQRYDRKHLSNLLKQKKNIDFIYEELSREAARIGKASSFDYEAAEFNLDDFPVTKKRIEELISKYVTEIEATIQEGSKQEWLLSEEKNSKLLDLITKKTGVERIKVSEWTNVHIGALKAFQERKNDKGKALSDRVWELGNQAKSQIELALDIGLGEGKSAAELSRDVREYLREPHKLFRRVRDKHGVLRLSKAAKAYHSGQGVYRSSYKNALRMTATENNMAYRTADYEAWSQIDFVIGQKVQLSNNHTLNGKPFTDICDELQGDYPKDFKFIGWHPFCRCIVTPILADWNEQLEVMKKRREGEDVSNYHFKGEVTDVPQGYKNWIADNSKRLATAKSVPYFIKDNTKYTGVEVKESDDKEWTEAKQKLKTIYDSIPKKKLGAFGTNIQKELDKAMRDKDFITYVKNMSLKDYISQVKTKIIKFKRNDKDIIKRWSESHPYLAIDGAKTHKELKERLKYALKSTIGNIDISISEKQISLDIAKQYAKQFVRLNKEYKTAQGVPVSVLKFKNSSSCYGSHTAYRNGNGSIVKRQIQVGADVSKARTNTHATSKSLCDADKLQISTITHEFGHAISVGAEQKFWDEISVIRTNYINELKTSNSIYLGSYANANEREFVAECFQEYKNKKAPSKYAKLVGAVIEKYFKR